MTPEEKAVIDAAVEFAEDKYFWVAKRDSSVIPAVKALLRARENDRDWEEKTALGVTREGLETGR